MEGTTHTLLYYDTNAACQRLPAHLQGVADVQEGSKCVTHLQADDGSSLKGGRKADIFLKNESKLIPCLLKVTLGLQEESEVDSSREVGAIELKNTEIVLSMEGQTHLT